MSELTSTILNSEIWKNSLAARADDSFESERARLRSSLISFRGRASLLSDEISKDLPDLTIHDVTHLDALWEVASQISGDRYPITPTEAYVLGGAFLLHDLAMSLAATPGGLAALKSDRRWRDLVFSAYSSISDEAITESQITNPEESIQRKVVFELLRQLHAENAEKLAFFAFDKNSATPQYLIEDTELRQTFGRLIGRVAHSHWWSVADLDREFDKTVGAPHWAPQSWTIDPLKLACILRAADAAHIDARRAPSFKKAFLSIGAGSLDHWSFQERINKAYLRDDSLIYTSGMSFSLTEARAWWLCLDTLKMIDKELRQVDSLLSERALPRFSARRVAGVDSPERLALYIQTIDWHPINAMVHISDLPGIVRSLGGDELYGKQPRVPLRELIQNASDAVRARRFFENRSTDFGEIKVSLSNDGRTHVLRVEDNGVGMSRRVLTDYLLDFGNSFWKKPQVQEEFPGLLSSGFRATGRYGIGFFSVFMAGDKVTVITRRPDAAAKETLVLEFGAGLEGRPILRPASRAEQLRDGGTVISIQLNIPPIESGGILSTWGDNPPLNLMDACKSIAPALDVKLTTASTEGVGVASGSNDWMSIEGTEFLKRLEPPYTDRRFDLDKISEFASKVACNLRLLVTNDGEVVGRAAIVAGGMRFYRLDVPTAGGWLCVGGFSATPLQGVAGVLLGESIKASRDSARPVATPSVLSSWASEQATLIRSLYSEPDALASAAEIIRVCGGDTGDLPVAINGGEWLSVSEIQKMDLPDTVIIVDHFVLDTELKHEDGFIADKNVFFTSVSGTPVVIQSSTGFIDLDDTQHFSQNGLPRNLSGAVLESVASVWGVDPILLSKQASGDRERSVRIGVSNTGRIYHCSGLVIRKSLVLL